MTKNLRAYLGTTGLSDVRLQFLKSDGTATGSAISAGIYELAGARGVYGIDSPTFPSDATDAYWYSVGTASIYGYETFDFRMPVDVVFAAVGGLLSTSVWTSTIAGRIDAAITSRMETFSYTAPDNTSITSIKTKTDNLPVSPASEGNVTLVKAVTDKLNTAIELSAGAYRFTTPALALAPSGGGGSGDDPWEADLTAYDPGTAGHYLREVRQWNLGKKVRNGLAINLMAEDGSTVLTTLNYVVTGGKVVSQTPA